MNRQDALSSFFEDPNLFQTLLELPERDLIRAILRHTDDCSQTPQAKRCVDQALSRAVGEIILQRAAERMGTGALETIRRELLTGNIQGAEPGIFVGPPTPAPGPRPPVPSPTPSPHHTLNATSVMRTDVHGKGAALTNQAVHVANSVVLDEFFAPAELEELTRFALEKESAFRISEVISPGVEGGVVDPEHRRSRVLMDLGHFEDRVFQRIRLALPVVLDKLGMASFPITRFESQITASNDGDYFRHHSDNAEQEIASRHLTFVYFFHREPKAFQGGELRIYDSRLESSLWQRWGNGKTVIPEQNQIVFFRSDLLHEISPVLCPSQAFADSRFTVNGWLHR